MPSLACDQREIVPSSEATRPPVKPKHRPHLRVKTNILLKKGMDQVGPMASWAPSRVAAFFSHAFATATIWLAIACLMGFFVSYLLVLSWADYSFVQPSAALANGLTALLAFYVLHEY